MVANLHTTDIARDGADTTALERDFPFVEISRVAEQESWRKEVNRPIYHIHKWWATRLGTVFRGIVLGALSRRATDVWEQFYKIHDLKGKIVLDPFMGSGTTLGEAVKLGATAIGCDINPVSTFLVRQAFTRVPEEKLRAAFKQLEEKVAPRIRHYYQTRDPDTGKMLPVLYYFWVKIVTTPGGEEIPLFSRYVFAQDAYPRKKPVAQILCPKCWGIFANKYDATSAECPHCKHHFNPQNGPAQGQYAIDGASRRHRIKEMLPANGEPPRHRLYAMMALRPDGTKIYLPAAKEDIALYEEAGKRLKTENLPLPDSSIRPGHNTNQARGYNYTLWRDFFNNRQLLCLGMLLREIMQIKDIATQEQMLCLFSSTLEFNNMFCSFKGEGTGAVRHLFSNHILKPERAPLENSVWGTDRSSGTFCTLFESRLLRARRYLDNPFEISLASDLLGQPMAPQKITASLPIKIPLADTWDSLAGAGRGMLILNGDSSRLPIPDASVDAVVTDPPYFDFIHYSELSDFFFAWLSLALRGRYPWFSRKDSSGNGEVQHKDPRAFARQLTAVFTEACRVLKHDGVLAFSFHHSRAEGWAAIYEAVNKAGMAVVAAYPVHAESKASTPKNAAKSPISIDAILVCRKRASLAGNPSRATDTQNTACSLIGKFNNQGSPLSDKDRFVIHASQTLIQRAQDNLSFDEIENAIDNSQWQ